MPNWQLQFRPGRYSGLEHGVPLLLNGDAGEDKQEDNEDEPDDDKRANDIRPSLEEREMEDAVVHHQNAELGPGKIAHVEDLRDQKELGDDDHVLYWNLRSMKPHAIPDHADDETHDDQIPSLESMVSKATSIVWRETSRVSTMENMMSQSSHHSFCFLS